MITVSAKSDDPQAIEGYARAARGRLHGPRAERWSGLVKEQLIATAVEDMRNAAHKGLGA